MKNEEIMSQHLHWKKSTALLAAAVVLALGGCASPEAPVEPEADEELVDITVLFASALNNVPMMVAAEQGYWRDRGLNVTVEVLDSGSQIATALIAGAADIGAGNATTAIPLSRAAGNDLVMVGPYHNNPLVVAGVERVGIVARDGVGIEAGDAESLAGKTIAIATGSTTESYLKDYLRQNGMSIADVNTVNLGVPDMATALAQGTVDAVVAWEPQISEILRTQEDAVVVERGGPYGRSVVGIMVTAAYFEENRDIVERYVLGAWEGDKYTREHPEEAALLAQRYINGLNADDAASGIERMAAEFDPRISVCTEEAIQLEQESLIAAGSMNVPEPMAFDEIVKADFIDELLEANPELIDDLPELPTRLSDCG
jgi:ABC-type nitrate/sulfonate/bicarbonate transport system substrate-binding protein